MGSVEASATPAITPRSPAEPALLTPGRARGWPRDKGNYHGLSQASERLYRRAG
jgi:hypothetical protein